MKSVQKRDDAKIIKRGSDDGKLKLGGKLGIGVDVTIPGTVEGKGVAGFSFKLPTWLTLDLIRRIGERIKHNHNGD